MFSKDIKRRDLEGIKFFSILFIVLYNLDINFFNGGFVGVDIFFVLIGYFTVVKLITNYENNSYNLMEFIESKLKNIFPL
ncbi:hypothetical protein N8824_04820, partial [Candidatus Pelagibacter sp.]|nr:hypothetical protein [Candidatus Pelagibacter sp.]